MGAAAETGDREPDWDFDGARPETILAGLGEELRGAYREVTAADQPEHLVGLAQKLDALITAGSEER